MTVVNLGKKLMLVGKPYVFTNNRLYLTEVRTIGTYDTPTGSLLLLP